MSELPIIKANWEAPENIIAFSSTRQGGVSISPFDTFNLAAHCGDNPDDVEINRQHLIKTQQLPTFPIWLQQTHSNIAIEIDNTHSNLRADASYTRLPNTICAILTADCLPILLCNKAGNEVAAIHAGWRGLAAGIIENTIKHFHAKPEDVLAWFGPAISQKVYSVGDDMRNVFVQHNQTAETAFTPIDSKHWLADLIMLARQRLQSMGVKAVYGGEFCTYTQEDLFFSYRRDGETGRIVSLIYCLEN